jgi:hypothetical protein
LETAGRSQLDTTQILATLGISAVPLLVMPPVVRSYAGVSLSFKYTALLLTDGVGALIRLTITASPISLPLPSPTSLHTRSIRVR